MIKDIDIVETNEWLDAFDAVVKLDSTERAKFILDKLRLRAKELNVDVDIANTINTEYINSIDKKFEDEYPGDIEIEGKIQAIIRWNAMMMVLNATKVHPELGGHIASYASAASLYEVGFNHFFKADSNIDNAGFSNGDLIFIQGHSSPGIYSRAYLEGRINTETLMNFRREIGREGLSSYPHPWLMPKFWQFPTVSMGLGPIQGIYQARLLKYLINRGLLGQEHLKRKVWVFCGDGEMDEPESLGAILIAARENLNNLIFVVNCNLQRLDGPVRGNGKIIQDLEGIFRGANWNTIKVIWSGEWDELLARDTSGALKKKMMETLDGDYQTYKSRDVQYFKEKFFYSDEQVKKIVEDYSDSDFENLKFGGHDSKKVYNAYKKAVNNDTDKPTIILAKTVKGYGMGSAGEAMNTAHQQKKMDEKSLQAFRDRFNLEISDNELKELKFHMPKKHSPELKYLHEKRQALQGYLPNRRVFSKNSIDIKKKYFEELNDDFANKSLSTSMCFLRILSFLLKDQAMGKKIVPIVPDECRTFGMEGLFRQIGIYSVTGQNYTPADSNQLAFYKEEINGQLIEEGINEAGALCTWIAAATSYSVHNLTLVPFYIYYSMFGYQRTGDLIWASGDMRSRGFIMGGTAGKTSLAGEGLQHQDGTNLLMYSFVPNCICYDPCFGYELSAIIQSGLEKMISAQEDIFYYIAIMNDNYMQLAKPKGLDDNDILRGMYLLSSNNITQTNESNLQAYKLINLLGSGAILQEVMKAADILLNDYKISSNVWSVTSFSELRKEAFEIERAARLNVSDQSLMDKKNYIHECFDKHNSKDAPCVAASDYTKLNADQIRQYLPTRNYITLGADGFGRSDTREALRDFFEVNYKHIVYASLFALYKDKKIDKSIVIEAGEKYQLNASDFDKL